MKPAIAKILFVAAFIPLQIFVFDPPSVQCHAQTARPQSGIQLLSFVQTIPGTAIQFEMIALPPGTILIADRNHSNGQNKIAIQPIWIGKTEVTWDEYDLYAFQLVAEDDSKIGAMDAIARPSKPYGAPDRGFGHQGFPALGMTFHAAQEYCRWLSAKTGKKYRLPTAAEWAYACRAGAADQLPKETLDQQAWYWENAEDKTQQVAAKQPNAWGLHDMLGNVAEWVICSDGAGVVAGGAFRDKIDHVHFEARRQPAPAWNMTDPQFPKSKWWLSDAPFVGFRLVCEPD